MAIMSRCFSFIATLCVAHSFVPTRVGSRAGRSIRLQPRAWNDVDKERLNARFEEARSAEKSAQEKRMAIREMMWEEERNLASLTKPSAEDRLSSELQFQAEKNDLVSDSIFISLLGVCMAWGLGTVTTAFSYLVGAAVGTGYVVLLAQYAGSFASGGGGGASSGRFALVIFLVLLAGKQKELIDIIPLLIGFFTYQVAALVQGIKAFQKF